MRAQKDTQDAFMRYTSCLDIERQARQAVASAEKRRDDISTPIPKTHLTTTQCFLLVAVLLSQNQVPLGAPTSSFVYGTPPTVFPDTRSRKSSISGDDRRSPPRYPMEVNPNSSGISSNENSL